MTALVFAWPTACARSTRPSTRPAGRAGPFIDPDGNRLGQKVTPFDQPVGIYVPGGKAAYPSSVLMNAIPAQVAGVGEILMVAPTPAAARATRFMLGAAHVAGVTRPNHRRGAGRRCVAYGTATIP